MTTLTDDAMADRGAIESPPMAIGGSPARAALTAVLLLTLFSPPTRAQRPALPAIVHDNWQVFTIADGLPDSSIRCVRVSNGKVWIGTDNGLALFDGGAWKCWRQPDGLPWPTISDIEVDPESGDVWLGTWGGGLVRFTGGRFDSFNQLNSGLAGDLVFDVAIAGDDVIAATNGGISRYTQSTDSWETYGERRADGPQTAYLDLSNAGGGLFAAAWCGPVVRLASGLAPALAGFEEPESVAAAVLIDVTLAMAASPEVVVWATPTDLLRMDKRGLREFRSLGSVLAPDEYVCCLEISPRQHIWLGTDRGLHVLTDWAEEAWISYRCAEAPDASSSPLPRGPIRCIAFDASGVWVGTANGLARFCETTERSDRQDAKTHGFTPNPPAGSATRSRQIGDEVQPPTETVRSSPVQIGVLGPVIQTMALPGGKPGEPDRSHRADLLAVQLAVEQVNARGGYRSQAEFAIAIGSAGFAHYGWGLPEDQMAIFGRPDGAWGVIGQLTTGSRVMSAVAFRTETPLVNVAAKPPSIDESLNPWVVRCGSNDWRRHRLVLDYVTRRRHCKRIAILRSDEPIARMHLDSWAEMARRRGMPPVVEVSLGLEGGELEPALKAIGAAQVDAVFTWSDFETSAAILKGMNELGMRQVFVGSDQIVGQSNLNVAGRDGSPIVAPAPCGQPVDPKALASFVERYTRRTSPARSRRPPPPEAFLSFEAAHHLMHAVNVAGLDREAIRRTLKDMNAPAVALFKEGRWSVLHDP